MPRSLWSACVERVVGFVKHLRSRPSNVRCRCGDADAQLLNGVCWNDYADSDCLMSQSVWQPSVERLDDNLRLVRDVCDKPNQPNKSCQPAESKQCCHRCTSSPNRTCNCAGNACDGNADGDEWIKPYTDRATDYYDRIDRQRNAEFVGQHYPVTSVPERGHFECPVNGKACGSEFCTKGVCEESRSRAEAGKHWCFTKTTDNH